MNSTRARVVILGIPLLAFGVGIGCLGESDHSYFDDRLDGSIDATAGHPEASSDIDAPMAGDGNVVVGTDDGRDAADDAAPIGDAGVVADGDADAAPVAMDAGPDAPVEAGCGPTNTPSNCSACGIACDTTSSVGTGCAGSTCTYASCKLGFSMCNPAAPNAAGCACKTPGCCGTACQSQHNNGLGQNFYDCVAVGTVDASAQAFKACTASKDGSAACSGGWACTGNPETYICDAPNPAQKSLCARCWSYQGADNGTVQDCSCPGVVIGNWN